MIARRSAHIERTVIDTLARIPFSRTLAACTRRASQYLALLQEQVAAETKEYGSGLENLGNTCYMNSCLQCLYAVPELAEALSNANNDGMNGRLAGQGRALLQRMAQGHTIAPWEFLTALRAVAPQFDEMGRQVTKNGRVHAQQDAEECWGAVCSCSLPHP